jgi:tight adherence protein B
VVELVAALAAFLAVMCAALGVRQMGGQRAVVNQRLARIAAQRQPDAEEDDGSSVLVRNTVSSVGPLRRLLSAGDIGGTIRSLNQAGVNLSVSEWVGIRLICGFVFFGFFFLVLGASLAGLFVGLAAGAVGYMLPLIWLKAKAGKRKKLITHQTPEALLLISNALRSGVAFHQAVKLAAVQVPEPFAGELQLFLNETSLGAPTDDALRALADRCGTTEMDMVATTIIIQRTTGGRLSEVLDRIAETLRDREVLHGEIFAMTGQQRLSGNVMAIYPFVLGGIITLAAPRLMSVMWQEPIGLAFLAFAVFLQFLGIMWMRMILKLDV